MNTIKNRIHQLLLEKEVLKKNINYSYDKNKQRFFFDKLNETEKEISKLQFKQKMEKLLNEK